MEPFLPGQQWDSSTIVHWQSAVFLLCTHPGVKLHFHFVVTRSIYILSFFFFFCLMNQYICTSEMQVFTFISVKFTTQSSFKAPWTWHTFCVCFSSLCWGFVWYQDWLCQDSGQDSRATQSQSQCWLLLKNDWIVTSLRTASRVLTGLGSTRVQHRFTSRAGRRTAFSYIGLIGLRSVRDLLPNEECQNVRNSTANE